METKRTIAPVAAALGIPEELLVPYGRDKAKVALSLLDQPRHCERPGRLILVSAMTPSPAGEGKTTTSIGLAQGLALAGERVALALREPSLGPVFGVKGGGTGGGVCRVEPSAEINLHFTGDIHAVTAAHNLLAAMVDNALHHDAATPNGTDSTGERTDASRVLWRRVMDMNDRALREVIVGLGGSANGRPRETHFDITAASEVMAVLCLASSEADLRKRLGRLLVGMSSGRKPVTADDLGATGAMLALLRDALMPNLVQTREGVPAFVHGGPFANIAHGCNSVLATRMALHTADWAVTEAGFGMDLGGEKFLDIKCPSAGISPAVVVVVATLRALKMHGGMALQDVKRPDAAAVERGMANLVHHLELVQRFGLPAIVAINGFPTDTEEERKVVIEGCARMGVTAVACTHFAEGGAGALELARVVVAQALETPSHQPLYDWSESVTSKVEKVARGAYGAGDVAWSRGALQDLRRIEKLGLSGLPICVAKTQSSLSDTPGVIGRPSGHTLHVEGLREAVGAGYIVVMTGEIVRMPGLPRRPSAVDVDIIDGQIVGVE